MTHDTFIYVIEHLPCMNVTGHKEICEVDMFHSYGVVCAKTHAYVAKLIHMLHVWFMRVTVT